MPFAKLPQCNLHNALYFSNSRFGSFLHGTLWGFAESSPLQFYMDIVRH